MSETLDRHRASISHPPHLDKLIVALSTLVTHARHVGVTFLTVLPHDPAIVIGVFPEEAFGVVVRIDVDLCKRVVSGWLLRSFVDTRLEPWQQQLQSVTKQSTTK